MKMHLKRECSTDDFLHMVTCHLYMKNNIEITISDSFVCICGTQNARNRMCECYATPVFRNNILMRSNHEDAAWYVRTYKSYMYDCTAVRAPSNSNCMTFTHYIQFNQCSMNNQSRFVMQPYMQLFAVVVKAHQIFNSECALRILSRCALISLT